MNHFLGASKLGGSLVATVACFWLLAVSPATASSNGSSTSPRSEPIKQFVPILRSPMRHPLLRILIALLIGLWSPVCCCQAMALAGSSCGDASVPEIQPDSCCQGCKSEPRSSEPGSSHDELPADHERSHPGDCPSCPSCQGTAGGASLRADARLASSQPDGNAIATMTFAVTIAPRWPDEASITSSLSRWGRPPFARANREAQRWHCALNM